MSLREAQRQSSRKLPGYCFAPSGLAITYLKNKYSHLTQRREYSRGTTLVPARTHIGGEQTLVGRPSSSCSDNEEQLRLAYSNFSSQLRDDFQFAYLM